MIHGKKKTQKVKSEEQLKEQNELSNKISAKLAEFFKIRKQPINLDNLDKLMQFTTILIQLCSDITSVYNYRRQLMENILKNTQEPMDKIKALGGQIKFITKIIQEDPKSYTLWSYRQWLVIVLYELDKSIITKEKQLCKMLLMKDEKNFHVWNYRNWANSIQMNIDDELAFTKQKISSNPFNFSPFHFRSKYLIKKYNESSDETERKEIVIYGMPKPIFNQEVQLVKTALFLNPKEEAPWSYYSWILKQLVPALFLKQTQKKILFSLKVSNIQDLVENEQKISSLASPSEEWILENEQIVNIFSNEQRKSEGKVQTTGRRIIGTKKYDKNQILQIIKGEEQFIMQVIESEENKCRFGWLQLLEINKNYLYLGTNPEKWKQIVESSLKIFQNLKQETKGDKYIQKQKQYWERLRGENLTSIEEGLKHYQN